MQVQDKIKKAHKYNLMSNSEDVIGKFKAGNVNEKKDITMNKGLMFSFEETQALHTLRNNDAIKKELVT